MIFYSTINSNKTDILVKIFLQLIKNGAKADEILVLVQNGKKKKNFLEKVKNNSPVGNIGNLNIFSFFGLARNFIEKNWVCVENIIKYPNSPVFGHLCGLETSQYIFKNCIKEIEFKGYNSKINLLHQLLRRYSLIVQNSLNEEEIQIREKILHESYCSEVRKAIKLYKLKTLELRAFDYLRQVSIFEYLYKKVKNPYKYVILDDGDEITPAIFEYLKYIKKDIVEFFIAQDPCGSSRLGYLSATHIDFEKFLNQKAQDLRKKTPKLLNALSIFENIKNKTPILPDDTVIKSFVRRDEMIFQTIEEIKQLIKNGVKPNEIAIVTPICDRYLRFCFNKINQDIFFLSGNEKLNQNPHVSAIIEVLKLANTEDCYLSPYTLKGILLEVLKVQGNEAIDIYQNYALENQQYKKLLKEYLKNTKNSHIQEFLNFLNDIKELCLSEQLNKICTKYTQKSMQNRNNILKLNKLAKQISDFEEIFGKGFEKLNLIEQLENTIIAENPLSEEEIPQNSIIVASAQKLIDSEICTKYLFLLDCSNSDWIKQDIGMLYNSWVFQKNWDKEQFDSEDNIALTLDRTARILYKLYLCKNKQMYVYSSIYDTLGLENFGAIDKLFKTSQIKPANKLVKIKPRDDQKPVLEYKSGKMAISAVAGSGKTTIMLALILKLLEGKIIKDIKSENIFVLTFMDSAARNFKERIKQNYPDMVELPQISTIHGLALRILKENNNYTFLGLDNNFEIIDENRRREIIANATVNNGLDYNKTDLYERAISDFKNENSDIKKVKSPSFKSVFSDYDKEMKENNYLDYDDLLILSLKLLRKNQEVLNYYQNLARVIVEDEAQDSSPIQQELINLLGSKWGNIIRCGDVNQAITATFSNSDVKGFKKFIKENYNIKMNKSQRCALKIIDLANKIIDNAISIAPQAFLDIKMQPVEGKNSQNTDAINIKLFEKSQNEKDYIAQEITKIQKKYPDKTIGILLRSNRQINNFCDFLENKNIKTQKNIDILYNNPVFKIVLTIFNFILDTKNKNNLKKCLEIMLEIPKYKDEKGILNFIQDYDFLSDKGAKYSLWWDLKYFLLKGTATPMELVLEIGDFYFKNTLEFANVSMIYSITEKIYQTHKSFEQTVARMNEIAFRINKSTKFYTEKNIQDKDSVKIMTLHKSKGDEFDFVFIPELSADNLGLEIQDIKLKDNTEFLQSIKEKPKSKEILKQEILEENYRLLYVGITRAKIKLYLTCSKTFKIYNKEKTQKPCEIFINEEVK